VKPAPRYLDGLPSIDAGELRFTFERSGGPGGQHVNRVATRATLWFDVAGSPSLTPAQRRRLAARLAARINQEGLLRVVSQTERTQAGNRREATRRFLELVARALVVRPARRPTAPTRAARERRLEHKRRRGEVKRGRGGGAPE